tara:strand:+ start:691 stop:1005 length:315 start_codon:yes stop_codon:yes gene_type:complete
MTKERDEIDEINKLRFKAFASNSADDLAAFREATAEWFMNEATRALDRSYAQEAEADSLRAEVARLTGALEAITLEYDTSGHGTIAEIMFGIARAALAYGEADQ